MNSRERNASERLRGAGLGVTLGVTRNFDAFGLSVLGRFHLRVRNSE